MTRLLCCAASVRDKFLINFTSSGLPAYNDWLTGVYEYIVKEYVEDVYVDIIETYVIATIKVAASRIKERE